MDARTEGGSVLKATKEDISKVFDRSHNQEQPCGVQSGATKCALYDKEQPSIVGSFTARCVKKAGSGQDMLKVCDSGEGQ